MDFLRQQLENQFMTGGLIIVIFTAFLATARNIPRQLAVLLKRRVVLTIDVADHDQAFYWIQKWLAEQPYSTSATLLTVSTRVQPTDNRNPCIKAGAEEKVDVIFSPAPGFHLLQYKNRWMLLTRTRERIESTISNQAYREMFTFQTFAHNRQIVIDLINEARLLAFPPGDTSITILRYIYGGWFPVMKRLPRPIDSVILQNNIAEDLIKDITEFLQSKEWYRSHGVPYQRGYLLFGSPGNGKTSLVHAIASKTKKDVYILKISTTTDDAIQDAMSHVSENGIVLLEDVDCAFIPREPKNDDKPTAFLTLSGFLNALDGISAHEGRLLFMTTNFKDKIDPAVIRPGRIDKEYHLSNATKDQALRLFLHFFPGCKQEAIRFSERIPDHKFSMASLQGHLLKHKTNVKEAAEWAEV